MKIQIWSEGYALTGNIGTAKLHGEIEAENLKDACLALARTDREFSKFFNSGDMTYWGCKLFDNKIDAIKSFN